MTTATPNGWLVAAGPMGHFVGDRYGTVLLYDADDWATLLDVVDGGDWPRFVKWNAADTSAMVRSPSEYDPRLFLLFFRYEMVDFACAVRRGEYAPQAATAPRSVELEAKIKRWLATRWSHEEDREMPGSCGAPPCGGRFPCRPRRQAIECLAEAGVVVPASRIAFPLG